MNVTPSISELNNQVLNLNFKGTLSRYKHIFSSRSRMGIPSIQSSMWAMQFCDVAITQLARAWPADLTLRPQSGVYCGISQRNLLHEDTERYRTASLCLSSACSLRFLGLPAIKRCIRLARSSSVGVVFGTRLRYRLGLPTHDIYIHHVLLLISNGFENSNSLALYRDTVPSSIQLMIIKLYATPLPVSQEATQNC